MDIVFFCFFFDILAATFFFLIRSKACGLFHSEKLCEFILPTMETAGNLGAKGKGRGCAASGVMGSTVCTQCMLTLASALPFTYPSLS